MLSRRLPALLVLLGQQLAGIVVVVAVLVATGEGGPGSRGVLLSIGAGLAGALALSTFYRALAVGTMSVVAPITSTSIVIPFAAGIAMGERPASAQMVGLALAAVGVVLASRETTHEARPSAAARSAVGLALLAALGFGLFATFSDAAADESILWFLLIARVTASAVIGAVGRSAGSLHVPVRSDTAIIVAVGMLDLGATALYAVAMTQGLLSVVSVVGSLFPVVTAVIAWIVLRERLNRVQTTGVVIAFVGVGFIAGG